MTKTYSKTRVLVECALMIAVGTVLANIKIYTLPNGGSVTLFSMLPFVLISFRHGVKWGLFTGFVNSLLQMLLGFWAPPSPTFWAFAGMILLDYVIAFTALGLACVFAKPFSNRKMCIRDRFCLLLYKKAGGLTIRPACVFSFSLCVQSLCPAFFRMAVAHKNFKDLFRIAQLLWCQPAQQLGDRCLCRQRGVRQ